MSSADTMSATNKMSSTNTLNSETVQPPKTKLQYLVTTLRGSKRLSPAKELVAQAKSLEESMIAPEIRSGWEDFAAHRLPRGARCVYSRLRQAVNSATCRSV